MRYTGRISSILLVILIQTSYVIYYFHRDGFIDIVGWVAYPVLLLISYWTGFQYDKANFYSERDPLTNLFNRRFIIKSFARYHRTSRRKKKSLFVLLLDCNQFKEINDHYGHAAGDHVLVEIGGILSRKRPNVLGAARWGGDEFIILGLCEDHTEKDYLIDELKERFAEIVIPDSDRSVSVSIGSAIQEGLSSDILNLVKQADVNMYKDKKVPVSVRNC